MNLSIIESAKEYKVKTLFKFMAAGGVPVSKEQGDARVEICKGCELYGDVIVEVSGLTLTMKGCGGCGCPSATKPYMKSLPRPKDKIGSTLTLGELVSLKMNYEIDSDKYENEIMICPHSSGNKWELVDNNF